MIENRKKKYLAIAVIAFLVVAVLTVCFFFGGDDAGYTITSITRINEQQCVITLDPEGATNCRIYRSVRGQNQFEIIGEVSGTVYYDHDLETNVEYEYYAASIGMDGSEYSATEPVPTGFNARKTSNVAVLMYHYFNTTEDVALGAFEGVFVEEIEADLKYFRDNGISTITGEELLAFINGEIDLPEKCVMITVDDGHYSIYEHLYPLLEEYNCKAVVSLVGEFISDLSQSRNPAVPMSNWMTWGEVAEIAESDCIEFGSHTNYMHSIDRGRYGVQMMNEERPEDYSLVLHEDMDPLNALIEQYCGYAPRVFAYPYSAPQGGYYGFMTEALGYELLLCGNETEWSSTNGNYFVHGLGVDNLEDRIIRRFGRYSGTDIEVVLNEIWNNNSEVTGN